MNQYVYIDLVHNSDIEIDVPIGLTIKEEKEWIKNYIENNLSDDMIGEPDYDNWHNSYIDDWSTRWRWWGNIY